MRPNLSVAGKAIPTPAEFATGTSSSQGAKLTKAQDVDEQTKPIDAAFNERVVRQQLAMYDAAVDNTRKRKDLPVHLVKLIKTAVETEEQKLNARVQLAEQAEADWHQDSDSDPCGRWTVINGERDRVCNTIFPTKLESCQL